MKQWTASDTVGLAIANAILILPPLAMKAYLETYRKPHDVPASVESYFLDAALGLVGAIVASVIAWRLGGSEHGRWAIHGLAASIILATYLVGVCIWIR